MRSPPSIVKQLPKMVDKRISDLSCDEIAFNNAKVTYELALKHIQERNEIRSTTIYKEKQK